MQISTLTVWNNLVSQYHNLISHHVICSGRQFAIVILETIQHHETKVQQ